VTLELDGRPWLTVTKGQTLETRLFRDAHELVVRLRATGKQLDRRRIVVGSSKAYVLNVLGMQTSYRGMALRHLLSLRQRRNRRQGRVDCGGRRLSV
jgi:hypothetical protein